MYTSDSESDWINYKGGTETGPSLPLQIVQAGLQIGIHIHPTPVGAHWSGRLFRAAFFRLQPAAHRGQISELVRQIHSELVQYLSDHLWKRVRLRM